MFTDLGESIITMNVESGYYHELNSVGSDIWRLLETPKSVAEICRALDADYDVGADDCLKDVIEFLGNIHKIEMVDVTI